MARDRYPLSSLKEVRVAEEEAARGAFVAAEEAVRVARAEKEAARLAVGAVCARKDRLRSSSGARAGDLDATARFRDRLADEEAAARATLRAREQAVRAAVAAALGAQAALAEASGHKQASARHEEAWEREQRKEAARREEREG